MSRMTCYSIGFGEDLTSCPFVFLHRDDHAVILSEELKVRWTIPLTDSPLNYGHVFVIIWM